MPRLIILLLVLSPVAAVEYRFPADANIIDVRRDFGARGDGVTDDTAAIQAAIREALKGSYRNPRFVYLAQGTYLISRSLRARITEAPDGAGGWSDGWRSGLALVGESREGTVIRLQDRCEGFQDPAKPRTVLITGSTGHGKEHGSRVGGWGNEGFQNTLMNFTVDTGSGNPGACGVDFLASNRGTMEEVTVRSGDGAGVAGLELTRPWPGPALIRQVRVEGFDYGLRQEGMDCSMTYEHLTFVGQRRSAIWAMKQPFMSLRGIISENAVPVLQVDGSNAIINVLDSRFTWTGAGEAPPAITCGAHLVLKGIAVEGYPVVVRAPADKKSKGGDLVTMPGGKGSLAFFTSRAPTRVVDGPTDRIPDLAVKETPQFHHSDFTRWAKPQDFALGSRTAGIQEAIDSGAEIVYLPNGTYRIEEPIILRGKLRKVMGMEAIIQRTYGGDGRDGRKATVMRFVGVEGGMLHLEHLGARGVVEQDCDQTLVIRKCDTSCRNTIRGTGDIFLEDGMFGHSALRFPGRLWARQYNSEFGKEPQFTNRLGQAWILGMKVEGDTHAFLNQGGISECYALYSMTGHAVKGVYVENVEGWLAISLREGGQGSHAIRFKDTWLGAGGQVGGPREQCLILGGGPRPADGPGPAAPTGIAARPTDQGVVLTWTAPPGGGIPLAYLRLERNGEVLAGIDADQTTWTDADAGPGQHRYALVSVDLQNRRSPAGEIGVTVPPDTRGPVILAAAVWPDRADVVTIDVDEALAEGTAIRPDSYRLDPPVPVRAARLNAARNRVILTLAQPLADGQDVTIACAGISDASGNATSTPEVAFTAWARGDGLVGRFWNARADFSGDPVHEQVDERINFWWGDGSPDPAVASDDFSARWTGVLRPRQDGAYRFRIGCRSGARLLLDGEVVFDGWTARQEWNESNPITLEAGRRYAIVLETHHDQGGAGIRLQWKGPDQEEASFPGPEVLFSR